MTGVLPHFPLATALFYESTKADIFPFKNVPEVPRVPSVRTLQNNTKSNNAIFKSFDRCRGAGEER